MFILSYLSHFTDWNNQSAICVKKTTYNKEKIDRKKKTKKKQGLDLTRPKLQYAWKIWEIFLAFLRDWSEVDPTWRIKTQMYWDLENNP